jgi:uncharacterized iron-regulated protein
MGKKITNEHAEQVLLTFHLANAEDEKYDEFREYYKGIVLLALHKNLGWTSGITELGYENIVEAYGELDSLGFTDEITKEDIANAVRILRG